MRPFDAVIFDVGGVLVESPVHAALRWQARVGIPDDLLLAFFAHYSAVVEPGEPDPPWHLVEKGRLPIQDFVDLARAELARRLPPGVDLPVFAAEDFNVYRDVPAHWLFVHAARRARRRGYRTAICTNNVREWAGWRDSLPVAEFDVVVDSCEVGMRKPEPEMYALVCEELGVEPRRAVFCDDFEGNVEAARVAGLTGLHVTEDLPAAVATLDGLLAARLGH